MNKFFDELGGKLAEAGRRRGVEMSPPELDASVAEELLELAAVTAHTQERRFAPLASYLAGVAAARLMAAGTPAASTIASMIREVREEMERSS